MKVYKAFIAEKTTYPANADYAFFSVMPLISYRMNHQRNHLLVRIIQLFTYNCFFLRCGISSISIVLYSLFAIILKEL